MRRGRGRGSHRGKGQISRDSCASSIGFHHMFHTTIFNKFHQDLQWSRVQAGLSGALGNMADHELVACRLGISNCLQAGMWRASEKT